LDSMTGVPRFTFGSIYLMDGISLVPALIGLYAFAQVFSDVEFLPWRTLARSNGIAVSVPLPYQGKVIGVLNIFLPEVYSIDERRMRLLETIAAAVSPAIESIKHDHISDRYHELVA